MCRNKFTTIWNLLKALILLTNGVFSFRSLAVRPVWKKGGPVVQTQREKWRSKIWQPRRSVSRFLRYQSSLFLTPRAAEMANDINSKTDTTSMFNSSLSPNLALDHFLAICKDLDSIQIVSRGSAQIRKVDTISIKSLIFVSSHHDTPFVVVLSEEDRVDVYGKLRKTVLSLPTIKRTISVLDNNAMEGDDSDAIVNVELAPSDQVQAMCGFMPGTVPPLGHFCQTTSSVCFTPTVMKNSTSVRRRPPSQLPIIVDQGLINQIKRMESSPLLLGGGGHPYWQCLLPLETLLQLNHVSVADVSIGNVDDLEEGASQDNTAGSFSLLQDDMAQRNPKPFFPIAPPPAHIAQLVMDQRDLSNPLTPSFVTVVGRVGKVRQMARKLAFADFLPMQTWDIHDDNKRKRRRDYDIEPGTNEVEPDPRPWCSGVDGLDMAVQLIVGKSICQRLGTARGEQAIKDLKEGQLVKLNAKTNVGNRESLENWVTQRSLDLIVFEYQVLSSEDGVNTVPLNGARPESGGQGQKNRRSPLDVSSSQEKSGCLTLKDLHPKDSDENTSSNVSSEGSVSSPVTIVDDMDSLKDFSRVYLEFEKTLTTAIGAEGDNNGSGNSFNSNYTARGLVGIDCEWKPQVFMSSPEPQPILLLQISFHFLRRVYIMDLMKLLRPLMPLDEPMNDLENAASDVLKELLMSKMVIKVGYQLSEDWRRLAASYPNVPAFQEIHSSLEVSTLVKRVLHITKQKRTRSITMSLSRLASHFLGKPLNKENQVSDWSLRPLTCQQIEYSALDAAISPVIVERVLSSIDADIVIRGVNRPVIERYEGDKGLAKGIESWRFLFLETDNSDAIRKLHAQRIVGGKEWIVSQHWTTGAEPPEIPSAPDNRGEPYVDLNGVLRLPSRLISIQNRTCGKGPAANEAFFHELVGQRVGRSKDKCLEVLVSREMVGNSKCERIDYPQRSGFVEFEDCVVLFVNMPNEPGLGQPRSYPNQWLEDGRYLTWFLRRSDWQEGKSRLAQKLLSPALSSVSNSTIRDQGEMDTTNAPSLLLLFVRMGGNGQFLCCGRCRAYHPESDSGLDSAGVDHQDWSLIQLNLELMDYDVLASCEEFTQLVRVD